MKRETMVQVSRAGESDDGCLTDMSAEAALYREIAELGERLAAHGLDLRADHAHAHGSGRDLLYWHYGYFIGLKQALALLTHRGATMH